MLDLGRSLRMVRSLRSIGYSSGGYWLKRFYNFYITSILCDFDEFNKFKLCNIVVGNVLVSIYCLSRMLMASMQYCLGIYNIDYVENHSLTRSVIHQPILFIGAAQNLTKCVFSQSSKYYTRNLFQQFFGSMSELWLAVEWASSIRQEFFGCLLFRTRISRSSTRKRDLWRLRESYPFTAA